MQRALSWPTAQQGALEHGILETDTYMPNVVARLEAEAEGRHLAFSTKIQEAAQAARDYALENDLTVSFESLDPLSFLHSCAASLPLAPESDDSDLEELQLPEMIPKLERLLISKEALAFVAECCQDQSPDQIKKWEDDYCFMNLAKHKIDLPLLHTDHASDVFKLRVDVDHLRGTICTRDHRLPMEPVDIENDEGLEFPQSAFQTTESINESVVKDLVVVSQDAMACLSRHLIDDDKVTENENMRLILEYMNYYKNPGAIPITPPLIPMSRKPDPFVPEGDVCLVDIPSDPSSLLNADLRAAEDALFQIDQDSGPLKSPYDFDSPSGLFADLPQFSEDLLEQPTRLDDLKVDIPLIPRENTTNMTRTPVDLGEFAQSAMWDFSLDYEDEDILSPQLWTDLEERAAGVMRKIEQEKLQAADALARVHVPVMDFSISQPPWRAITSGPMAMMTWLRKNHPDAFRLPEWPRDKRAEMKMRWSPLQSDAGRISFEEKLECSQELTDSHLLVLRDNGIPNSADFVRKSPGFMFLGNPWEDDDDEIEPRSAKSASPNLMAIVKQKRRRLKVPAGIGTLVGGESPFFDEDSTSAFVEQRVSTRGRLTMREIPDDGETASTLLDSFMELRTGKEKPGLSRFFGSTMKPGLKELPKHRRRNSAQKARSARVFTSAPYPQFDACGTPSKVILSLGIAHGVRAHLFEVLPNVAFIERDYGAYNSSTWLSGSVCRSEIASALADEADIIVSAETGIVITTLVRLRQKSLPGSPGRNTFRSRLEKISARYDRLVVLVSESAGEDCATTGTMTPSDAMALVELQGFVAGLDDTVVVHFVGGGELTVARWAAALICHNNEAGDAAHFLIDSETFWELYLRRAGLNAYAAQAICGILKEPDAAPENAGRFGLPAFVRMSLEERLVRFQKMCGGRRVLERVSQVIDASWQ